MANSLGSNPWVIDTPGATILCSTEVKVNHFEFAKYAAQNNVCTIQDRNGKAIWDVTGAGDFEEVRSGKVGWVQGIAVVTLQGNGVCRIYFD